MASRWLISTLLVAACAARAWAQSGAASSQPAPCAGEQATKVEALRAEAAQRVALALQVAGNHAQPTQPLPNGARMTSGALYTLVNAAMLFGNCPVDLDHFETTTDCASSLPDEQIDTIMTTSVQVMTGMRNLIPSVAILCSPRGDPFCGHGLQRGAYSRATGNEENPRNPAAIYLCPAFFRPTDLGTMTIPEHEGGIRTIIHESAHLAGVHRDHESYCPGFDCSRRCGPPDNADSWAHLVNCLSGAPRDGAAFDVTGHASH